jgi:hypothetical protein
MIVNHDSVDFGNDLREELLIEIHDLLSHFLNGFRTVGSNFIGNMGLGALEDELV